MPLQPLQVRALLIAGLVAGPSVPLAVGQNVNALIPILNVTQEVPGSSVEFTDDIANGSFTFSETGMNALSDAFNNNRHEFRFSEDGFDPIVVNGDDAWDVQFDISLNGTFLSPRKSFQFTVFDGPNSNVNLTTNRTPVPDGISDPPGESAMFGGQYSFVRLVGPPDGDPKLNLNPTVGYTAGTTVNLRIIHRPSPDGGISPSTVEHQYDDGTGPYTTGPRPLRNSGVFDDNAELGFILQGIAHASVGTDSYSVTISNFSARFGELGPEADFDGDGDVDGDDFLIWQANFPTAAGAAAGDADADGDVDGDDFLIWQAQFGTAGGAAAAVVPEPAAWLLVPIGSVWLASRGRSRVRH